MSINDFYFFEVRNYSRELITSAQGKVSELCRDRNPITFEYRNEVGQFFDLITGKFPPTSLRDLMCKLLYRVSEVPDEDLSKALDEFLQTDPGGKIFGEDTQAYLVKMPPDETLLYLVFRKNK